LIAPQSRRVASGAVLSVIGLVMFPAAAVPAAGSEWRPAPRTTWQWQLSGDIDTSVDAEVFDIDLFDTAQETIELLHAQGRRIVCHFSAGSYDVRRPDAGNIPRRVRGASLDPPYASERWLDIRSKVVRTIMEARLDVARAKGCDGVEPDNMDGYEHDTRFKLTARHQRAYNRFIASAAHERDLAVALKNNAKQAAALEPHFDFAVVEQCFEFDECAKYEPFVDRGKAVLQVEYDGEPAEICPAAARLGFSAILKQSDVGAARVACPPGG
jgi:hypothetical protein